MRYMDLWTQWGRIKFLSSFILIGFLIHELGLVTTTAAVIVLLTISYFIVHWSKASFGFWLEILREGAKTILSSIVFALFLIYISEDPSFGGTKFDVSGSQVALFAVLFPANAFLVILIAENLKNIVLSLTGKRED